MYRSQRKTVVSILPLAVALAIGLNSCGAEPKRSKVTFSSTSNNNPYKPGVDSPAQPQPSPSPTENLAAPLQVPIKASGNAVVKLKVSTQRTLRLRFTPKPSTQKAPGQNYVANYSKLGVTITVGDVTYSSGVLDNGLNSGRPQVSPVLDFSSAIPSGGTSQEMEITIESPLTDYYCFSVSWVACPYSPPIAPLLDLPWNGLLTIETDNTGPV